MALGGCVHTSEEPGLFGRAEEPTAEPSEPVQRGSTQNPQLPVVGETLWTSDEGLALTVRIAVHAVRRIPGATVLDWSVTPLSGAGLNNGEPVPASFNLGLTRFGEDTVNIFLFDARRGQVHRPADPDRPGTAGMSLHTLTPRAGRASRGRNQPVPGGLSAPAQRSALGRRGPGDRAHLQQRAGDADRDDPRGQQPDQPRPERHRGDPGRRDRPIPLPAAGPAVLDRRRRGLVQQYVHLNRLDDHVAGRWTRAGGRRRTAVRRRPTPQPGVQPGRGQWTAPRARGPSSAALALLSAPRSAVGAHWSACAPT